MSYKKRISVGSMVILVVAAGFISYKYGLKKSKQDVVILQEQIATHLAEKTKLQEELKLTQQNYQIQLEAKKNLAAHIKSLQDHNSELAQNMNLYDAVTGKSELPGVEMKTFQIYPTGDAQTYRYSIVLSKMDNAQSMIQGALSLVIVGNIGEKVIFLPVKYVN